jgi:hypothetical protein
MLSLHKTRRVHKKQWIYITIDAADQNYSPESFLIRCLGAYTAHDASVLGVVEGPVLLEHQHTATLYGQNDFAPDEVVKKFRLTRVPVNRKSVVVREWR